MTMAQGTLGSGPDLTTRTPGDPQIAFAGMKLVVPEAADSGSPIELGDIIITATH